MHAVVSDIFFGTGNFLLRYKVEKEKRKEKKVGDGREGAPGPRGRTFQTYYSEKECGEIAPGMMGKHASVMKMMASGEELQR